MYKWHVHSAIGRGRPQLEEFTKVADGIAASLRLFHVSASAAAEDGGEKRATLTSRAQRSAAAAAEISSLSPGGIDARSLAATPPPSFTIRRVDVSGPAINRPPGALRGTFRGQDAGMRGNFGSPRGRGSIRGQRGQRSRGREGRGAANGSRNKRRGGSAKAENLQSIPLTPEEQAYVDSIEMGVETPAKIELTDAESLKREGPGMPTLTAPMGMVNTIHEHYRVFAGEFGRERLSPKEHAQHYLKGATLFVDDDDMARATGPTGSPGLYEPLGEADREAILQTLVAGHYQPIRPVLHGDVLSNVDNFTRKNETFLPKDGAILREKVQRMIAPKPAPKPATSAARQ